MLRKTEFLHMEEVEFYHLEKYCTTLTFIDTIYLPRSHYESGEQYGGG